jgi:hypothetical protein
MVADRVENWRSGWWQTELRTGSQDGGRQGLRIGSQDGSRQIGELRVRMVAGRVENWR